MSNERVRELLSELKRELDATSDIDATTRAELAKLDDELDAIAGGSSALDWAKDLESRFAAGHPVVERITREIADIIAKMGI